MRGDSALSDEVDPDAPWKPGFVWPDAPGVATTDRDRAGGPPIAGGSDMDLEMWSRTAVEQPVSWKDWVPPPELRRDATRRPPPATPRAPVTLVDGSPATAVTGEVVLGGVAVLAFVVLAVFAVVLLVPDAPEAPEPVVRDALVERADVLWSVELDGRVAATTAADGVLVVDTGPSVHAFDQLTGAELWVREPVDEPFARDLLASDGGAFIFDHEAGGPTDLVAVDLRTGTERWSRSDPGGAVIVVDERLIAFERGGSQTTVQLVDPLTGEGVGPRFGVGPTSAAPPYVASWRGDSVALHDLETGGRLGPRVDGVNLRALDVVGGVLVGFDTDDKIVVFDDRGVRSDERRFVSDAFGDFSGRAALIGSVPGREIAILSSGTSLGFTVAGGNIEVVWEVDGRVGTPVDTEVGAVSVARVIDADSGEVNHALVAAATGETLTVTDSGVTREEDPQVRWNGYVLAPEAGRTERVLDAFDFDGERLWSLTLPDVASFVLADRSLVVLERGLDRTTVTAYG
jgi:outer membrane protein assembly factor BamB